MPIVSLYGNHRKPYKEDLDSVDLILFDVQDVGARFYTYISTLHYVLEAAGQYGKPVLILDRPNPNGMYVEGPMREPDHKSFLAIWPIPILHGCTMGEIANMAVQERWVPHADSVTLTVITASHYAHDSSYVLPVRPSPNLPNQKSIELYASLCLFEQTPLSVGRGTEFAFQVVGGEEKRLGAFTFTPVVKPGAVFTVLGGKVCHGIDYRDSTLEYGFDLSPLLTMYHRSADKAHFFKSTFPVLAGTKELERQIRAGWSQERIRVSWEPGLEAYRAMRRRYLLYKEETE